MLLKWERQPHYIRFKDKVFFLLTLLSWHFILKNVIIICIFNKFNQLNWKKFICSYSFWRNTIGLNIKFGKLTKDPQGHHNVHEANKKRGMHGPHVTNTHFPQRKVGLEMSYKLGFSWADGVAPTWMILTLNNLGSTPPTQKLFRVGQASGLIKRANHFSLLFHKIKLLLQAQLRSQHKCNG